jgi:hypothetical protein
MTTMDDLNNSLDWALAENRRLTAEVQRLRAERDAILRWSIRHAGYIGTREDPELRWWARGDDGTVYGRTAEEAVRRAAGLDAAANGGGAL